MLGQGAFAQVFRGFRKDVKNPIAVKVYKKSKMKDDETRDMVAQEVQVMRGMEYHNHVIHLIDVHETYRGMHLVMEYAGHGSLFGYVRKHKRLSEEMSQQLFKQIADGVQHLHSNNRAHRDIKVSCPSPAIAVAALHCPLPPPSFQLENVLFVDKSHLKLADFGFACVEGATARKMACGSLLYVREFWVLFPFYPFMIVPRS